MVSPLRELWRRLEGTPISLQKFGVRPLPKPFVQAMLGDPEYRPEPPEACECAVPVSKPGESLLLEWRPCTRLGVLDGTLPDTHVRMGQGDYLMGFLGIRACRKPGEAREQFPPYPGEVRGRRAAQRPM